MSDVYYGECFRCGAKPNSAGPAQCFRHDCPNIIGKTVSLDTAQDARIRGLEERVARLEKLVRP